LLRNLLLILFKRNTCDDFVIVFAFLFKDAGVLGGKGHYEGMQPGSFYVIKPGVKLHEAFIDAVETQLAEMPNQAVI
jgi:hypothetical protein